MSSPVTAVTYGNRVVVHLAGEVDIFTTGKLREQLGQLIAQRHTDIVVDLTGVTFIDSTGLGVLVAARKTALVLGGRVELVTADAGLLRLLRITALARMFVVHRSMAEALAVGADAPLNASARLEVAHARGRTEP